MILLAYRPSTFHHEAKLRAMQRELADMTKQDPAWRRGSVWAHDPKILFEQRGRGLVALFLPFSGACSLFRNVLPHSVNRLQKVS